MKTLVYNDAPKRKYETSWISMQKRPFIGYGYNDHPETAIQWAHEFGRYCKYRYENESPDWGTFFPEKDSPEQQLQHLADLAYTQGQINLGDPAARTFFLEYLSAFRERIDWWRRFELRNGPCHVLDMKNLH